MTIKQGEQINKSFDEYEEKVSKLKDTITILKNNLIDGKKQYVSLDSNINLIKLEVNEYKWKYEENKRTYLKHEALFLKTHNTDILQKILFSVLVTFLFLKIN
jgi:chromosome segregation ATPase